MTWDEAMQIAFVAMGKKKKKQGEDVHRAHEDPLAWWCLVELLYDKSNAAALRAKAQEARDDGDQ